MSILARLPIYLPRDKEAVFLGLVKFLDGKDVEFSNV